MTDIRATLPTPGTGAPLNAARGWFSVIIPIARTNEITNPSFELGTASWAAVGGSIARVTTQQAVGVASLQITMSGASDGARYSSLPMVAGALRACRCWFKGTAGRRYRFQIEDGGGSTNAKTVITATGRWQEVIWYCSTPATATYYMFVGAEAAGADVVYLDGVQVEIIQPGETVSTYIDGDQMGLIANAALPAYGWNGAPHASTSYRSAQTRAGGMVMAFDLARFVLTAIIGLGLAPAQHIASPYAQLDGASYERTRLTERTFSLIGRADGRDDGERTRNLAMLETWLSRDLIATQQPLRLRYERFDGFAPTSEVGVIDAVYTQGLEGNIDSRAGAAVPLQFTLYAPYISLAREEGATLTTQQTVTNANKLLVRSPEGDWYTIGTGGAGGGSAVWAIAQGTNGIIYIGGTFTSFNGVANTRSIAQYDPVSGVVSAMGTGVPIGGSVNGIEIAPNGDVWVFGTFTDMGGIGAADYVARWDGSAWNAVGTPTALPYVNSQRAVFGLDGSFYYATMSNATVRRWNGAAWSTLGTVTGGGAEVYNIIRAPNGDLVVSGDFTAINGVSALNIARWDGNFWRPLNGAIPGSPYPIAYDTAGMLYAGGPAATSNLWAYNGTAWTTVGTIGTIGTQIWEIVPDPRGGVYVAGTFTGGGILDGMGFWNGSTLTPLGVDLPGGSTVTVLRGLRDGSLVIGYADSGSATAAALTTVINRGAARAYPTLQIHGPASGTARVYQVVNTTTGRAVYLSLTLQAGETATFVFQPERLAFTSTFQGNIASTILPGSQEADFFLQPGPNVISVFAANSSVTATLRWQPTFQSLNQFGVQ